MAELTQEEKDKLYADWEAEWAANDFSWEGLKNHKWRAPAVFRVSGELSGEGDSEYKESTLQDYWRWSLGVPGYENTERLLTDEELLAADLLQEVDGQLWHIIHLKKTDAAAHPALAPAIMARLGAADPNNDANKPGYRGPDGRAQFNGARASKLDRLWRQYDTVDELSLIHI